MSLVCMLVQAIVAGCALVKNAALSRALRRKDTEMNQLILLVGALSALLSLACSLPYIGRSACSPCTCMRGCSMHAEAAACSLACVQACLRRCRPRRGSCIA